MKVSVSVLLQAYMVSTYFCAQANLIPEKLLVEDQGHWCRWAVCGRTGVEKLEIWLGRAVMGRNHYFSGIRVTGHFNWKTRFLRTDLPTTKNNDRCFNQLQVLLQRTYGFDYKSLDICQGERPLNILYRPYDRLINRPAINSVYHSVRDKEGVSVDGFLISLLLEFSKNCRTNYTLFTSPGVTWSSVNPNESMVEMVSVMFLLCNSKYPLEFPI